MGSQQLSLSVVHRVTTMAAVDDARIWAVCFPRPSPFARPPACRTPLLASHVHVTNRFTSDLGRCRSHVPSSRVQSNCCRFQDVRCCLRLTVEVEPRTFGSKICFNVLILGPRQTEELTLPAQSSSLIGNTTIT